MITALQDVVAGDGTTSVTVICGALLKKCLDLLERGVHPTVISDAFNKAAERAVEVCSLVDWWEFCSNQCSIITMRLQPWHPLQILEKVAIPVDLADRDALIKAANT